MIPLHLQLKNFLSYASPVTTIDFEGHHLICLSGKNGHGKSALLDAITWALWGQARKVSGTSKADDGLMRIGQSHMMVALDFIANGTTYRVRREYSVTTGKPVTQLDFGVLDIANGNMSHLTDKTIRATQAVINNHIGLDYDTFINSAFIRQGQSNEFSKKSPRERKDILASILGLDRFESLRKKAHERAKTLENDQLLNKKTFETLNAELMKQAEVALELKSTIQQLKQIVETEKKIQENFIRLKNEKLALETENQEHIKTRIRAEQLFSHYKKQETLLLEKVKNWRTTHHELKTLNQQDGTAKKKELEALLVDVKRKISTLKKLKEEASALKDQVHTQQKDLSEAYNAQMQELVKEISSTQIKIQNTQKEELSNSKLYNEKKAQLQKLLQEIATLLNATKPAQDLAKTVAQREQQFERRKTLYQSFVSQGNFLKKNLQEIQEKKDLLANADAQCPLCDSLLEPQQHAKLQDQTCRKASLHAHQIQRLSRVLKSLKEQLTQDHEQLVLMKKTIQEIDIQKTRLQEAQKQHDQATESIKRDEIIIKDILREQEALRNALANLEKKQLELGTAEQYAQKSTAYLQLISEYETKQKDVAQLDELEKQEQEYHAQYMTLNSVENISGRLALQNHLKSEIHELISTLKHQKKEYRELNQSLKMAQEIVDKIEHIKKQEIELNELLKQTIPQKEQLLAQKGALEAQIKIFDVKQQEIKTVKTQLIEIENQLGEYQAIAQALSKDGIQALLIEEAIPEIESETNELLSKLTDNQAHVIIESLRDLKSGATRETLDIKISDPIGIRPYELFSGGEAFRIDFALRIAISKLLARRAGATLQTLIIDEGFGSQDEEGLAHIMEALHKIQDDFAKIIVVSHLPSMKDQFPVHFVVQKTPQGSTVNIIEQG